MRKSLVILMLVSLLDARRAESRSQGDFASDAGIGIAMLCS